MILLALGILLLPTLLKEMPPFYRGIDQVSLRQQKSYSESSEKIFRDFRRGGDASIENNRKSIYNSYIAHYGRENE